MIFQRYWNALPVVLAATVGLGGCARNAIDPGYEGDLDAEVEPAPDAGSSDAGSDGAPLTVADASSVKDAAADAGSPDAGQTGEEDAGDAPEDAGAEAAVPETGAGDGGTSECVPGIYKGAFSGQVRLFGAVLGSLLAVDISGEISITVDTESAGEKLVIKDGTVNGEDQDGNPVKALVNGTLNCRTKKLEGGTLTEGTYKRPLLAAVNFTGTVTADYSPNPPSATGKWETTASSSFESGGGTWTAALVP